MKNFIVIESANWGDEFDIQGFKLFKAESIEEVENKLLDGKTFPCEIYFGTNEFQEYENKEQFLGDVEIKEISEEQVKVLKSIFGELNYAFGTTAIL